MRAAVATSIGFPGSSSGPSGSSGSAGSAGSADPPASAGFGGSRGPSGPRRDPLQRRVDALGELLGLSRTRVDADALAEAGELLDRVADRRRLSLDHTVVALAGATGSGKSALFNALTGLNLSEVGVRRPTTQWPVACAWDPPGAVALLDRLGIPPHARFARRSLLDGVHTRPGGSDSGFEGLILLDLPDHDSASAEHRQQVDRMLELVDVLVWVVDPEKYADAVLHERYLRPLAGHADVTLIVLNQVDRLPYDAADQVLDDLRRLLDEDGLALGEHGEAGAVVLPASALTGEGVADLRAAIGQVVADRSAADRRLAADVDRATERLRPVYVGYGALGLTDTARENFIARLAEAVGAEAVGRLAEREWSESAARACGLRWSRLVERAPGDAGPAAAGRPGAEGPDTAGGATASGGLTASLLGGLTRPDDSGSPAGSAPDAPGGSTDAPSARPAEGRPASAGGDIPAGPPFPSAAARSFAAAKAARADAMPAPNGGTGATEPRPGDGVSGRGPGTAPWTLGRDTAGSDRSAEPVDEPTSPDDPTRRFRTAPLADEAARHPRTPPFADGPPRSERTETSLPPSGPAAQDRAPADHAPDAARTVPGPHRGMPWSDQAASRSDRDTCEPGRAGDRPEPAAPASGRSAGPADRPAVRTVPAPTAAPAEAAPTAGGRETVRRAAARPLVAEAVRGVAAEAADGLPAPWSQAVHDAAVRGSRGLPEALDMAVAKADECHVERPRWWAVVGVSQWLLMVLSVIGAVGLVAVAVRAVPVPVWLPGMVFGLGTAGGPVLAWSCCAVSRGTARRHGQNAERRLRDAAADCGRARVLEPVAAELLRYREVREQYGVAMGARVPEGRK